MTDFCPNCGTRLELHRKFGEYFIVCPCCNYNKSWEIIKYGNNRQKIFVKREVKGETK